MTSADVDVEEVEAEGGNSQKVGGSPQIVGGSLRDIGGSPSIIHARQQFKPACSDDGEYAEKHFATLAIKPERDDKFAGLAANRVGTRK